jgi:hypothetical protein
VSSVQNACAAVQLAARVSSTACVALHDVTYVQPCPAYYNRYRIKPRRPQFTPKNTSREFLHRLVTATTFAECKTTNTGRQDVEEESFSSSVSQNMHKAMTDKQSIFDNVMVLVIIGDLTHPTLRIADSLAVLTRVWFGWVGGAVNSAMLSCVWVGQSDEDKELLRKIDYVFVAAYSFEVVAKIGGLGSHVYFRGYWNLFDFAIVVASILDLTPVHDVVDTSIFQTMRLLRMCKLVRLWPLRIDRHRELADLGWCRVFRSVACKGSAHSSRRSL